MTTLCITGWQQPADALASIAPQDALHATYEHYSNVPSFLESLPRQVGLAVGWSLGGQLLLRAIAGGYVKARQVIVLGAPFQFLASDAITAGMPREMWAGVVDNYKSNPAGMLRQFAGIISTGDAYAPRITRALSQNINVWEQGLFWLEELGRFSCDTLEFTGFPPTLVIQGESDRVVYPAQAKLLAKTIPGAALHMLERCAHAPHLHDMAGLKKLVLQHV